AARAHVTAAHGQPVALQMDAVRGLDDEVVELGVGVQRRHGGVRVLRLVLITARRYEGQAPNDNQPGGDRKTGSKHLTLPEPLRQRAPPSSSASQLPDIKERGHCNEKYVR